MNRIIIYIFLCILLTLPTTGQQVNNASQKKFSVYKSNFNPAFAREGTIGISVLFSCEYLFAEAEYPEFTDKQGKTYFVYYLQLFNQNNEPVYYPFDYQNFTKALTTTAIHFSTEDAYKPQVATQGRRNTGISLFIPFAHLDLPEGTHILTATLNAYSQKTGKRYENFYVEKITVNKPASYWVQLTPQSMSVTTKSGQKLSVSQVEEDISIIRGTNLKYPDIASSGNAAIKKPVSFILSEGDVCNIRVHKNTQNIAKVISYELPTAKGADGKPILNFDGKPQGDFALNPEQKSVSLKNNFLEWSLSVEKLKIPPVKLSFPKIKPFLTHEGMTGMSVSFDYETSLSAGLPPLQILPLYCRTNEDPEINFKNGKVLTGKAETDTSGAITLLAPAGTVEVFYSFAGFTMNDPDIVLKKPNITTLRAKLKNNTSTITRKSIRQGFQPSAVRNAKIETVVWAKDTILNDERGLQIQIPYSLPDGYYKLLQKDIQLKITTAVPDDKGKFITMFRRMNLLGNNVQRLKLDTADTKSISYKLLTAKGNLTLFLPYTEMGQQQTTGLPFLAKILVNQGDKGKTVDLGGNESQLKFQYETAKIRLLTMGIAGMKLKKDETGVWQWRVKSEKAVIYQSPVIPIKAKDIKNDYAQYFSIHEEDKVYVEVLKGTEAGNLKRILYWEMPVKQLSGEKIIEFENGKSPELKEDDNIKTVILKYGVN
jgi:hypothetical protein